MPEFGNPVSAAVAGTSPQIYTPGVNANSVRFYNQAATAVYITVGGTATVAGANEWYLPGVIGAYIDVNIHEQWMQGEQPQTILSFSLASSATIAVYAVVSGD